MIEQNTPETDDLTDDIWATPYVEGTDYGLMLEHARKLERERDEAVRSCHIWQKGHSDIVAERDLWKLEAKRWKIISQTQTKQHYANPN
jgi:hypothetical protein